MKKRPILFNGEMVRALLEGRKTQTRRVIKPQPVPAPLGVSFWYPDADSPRRKHYASYEHFLKGFPSDFSTYGQVGDRLWVRETFRGGNDTLESVFYRADDSLPSTPIYQNLGMKWTPSIFMPRALSRINLDILKLRVQRIQDISDEDIYREGAPVRFGSFHWQDRNRGWFKELWNSINAKPKAVHRTINEETEETEIAYYVSYPWEGQIDMTGFHKGKPHYIYGNPWVRVVDFKRLKK